MREPVTTMVSILVVASGLAAASASLSASCASAGSAYSETNASDSDYASTLRRRLLRNLDFMFTPKWTVVEVHPCAIAGRKSGACSAPDLTGK